MKTFTFAIFFVCFAVICGERVLYDGYRVFSIKVENEQQLEALLESVQDGISFFKEPTGVPQIADLVVAPSKVAYVSELFATYKIKSELKTMNLQKLIDAEQPAMMRSGGFGWTRYNDLGEIYAWLNQLLKQFPSVLTNIEYGKSYEGRSLRAIKVSHKQGNPTIFIESTIHAREWITAATATYFLNELIFSNNSDIRYLAENYDWIFVPVVNVDGYQYTHTTNRLWRKTRRPSSMFCIGTDPNRNFDFHHAETGASSNPCSETYAGPKPFSEPETLSLSNLIKNSEHVNNLKLYISFHSFSQLLMFPYGHTTAHAPNHDDLKRIGLKTTQAIRQRYGTSYGTGSIAEAIYTASGSSIDWVYDTQNVPLTYTFEFRDKGQLGFVLPANQIIPNSLEVIDGLVAMVKEAKNLKYL